jgi:hypothetical protein
MQLARADSTIMHQGQRGIAGGGITSALLPGNLLNLAEVYACTIAMEEITR